MIGNMQVLAITHAVAIAIDILKWSRSTISSCMQTTGLASYNLLATATAIAIHFVFFYLCTP